MMLKVQALCTFEGEGNLDSDDFLFEKKNYFSLFFHFSFLG